MKTAEKKCFACKRHDPPVAFADENFRLFLLRRRVLNFIYDALGPKSTVCKEGNLTVVLKAERNKVLKSSQETFRPLYLWEQKVLVTDRIWWPHVLEKVVHCVKNCNNRLYTRLPEPYKSAFRNFSKFFIWNVFNWSRWDPSHKKKSENFRSVL